MVIYIQCQAAKKSIFHQGMETSIKGFNCEINGRPVYVAGLPHLSRYSPMGKNHVVEWLSKQI